MNALSSKLGQFHQQIRKKQLSSLIKKARYQAARANDQQIINTIINTPNQLFTKQQLQILISLANDNNTNAICHIGNLVIDRILTVDVLANVAFNLGQNQMWTWLINVLGEIGYCTPQMFDYNAKRIIVKKTSDNLFNALEAFHKFLKINKDYSINYLEQSPELIIALCNHVNDPVDKIALSSLTIFSKITCQQSESLPKIVLQAVKQHRLTDMLLHTLMKLHPHPRMLACQIANNCLLWHIVLEKVAKRILQLSMVEKQSVKCQISYYWMAFVESVEDDILFIYIRDFNLLGVLRQYYFIESVNSKYDDMIRQNAKKAVVNISERFEFNIRELILKEIRRLGLLEEQQTQQDQNANCLD